MKDYERIEGTDSANAAIACNNLAEINSDLGKYTAAEPLYLRALHIHEKSGEVDAPSLAADLNNLGGMYFRWGKYSQAEASFQRAAEVWQKSFGEKNPDLTYALNGVADMYEFQGKYADAERTFHRAVEIARSSYDANSPHLAHLLGEFAGLYVDEGRFAEAEPLYQEALQINEKALGPDHPQNARLLNSMAELRLKQGRVDEAEKLFTRALKIREDAFGPDHIDVATCIVNVAAIRADRKEFDQAEPLFKRALGIFDKAAPGGMDRLRAMNILATMYEKQKRYAEAESLVLEILQADEALFGESNPETARTQTTLAMIYMDERKFPEAGVLAAKALATLEKAYGPDHPDVGAVLFNTAVLYYRQGAFERAESAFERAFENLRRQFDQQFTYMSEKERLSFLAMVASDFPAYMSFCSAFRDRDPSLAGRMYDLSLWQKGLIARSMTAFRARIEANHDNQGLALLDELSADRAEIARLYSARPAERDEWQKKLDDLARKTNDVERHLVTHFASLDTQQKLATFTWKDIQKKLQPDEAAIEFVRFANYDGAKWSGKRTYLAMILTHETTTAPKLVVLGDADELEGAALQDYRSRVAMAPADGAGRQFYRAFWKPIEPSLAGIRRLYVSPDGALNQVAFDVVPGEDGTPLLEKYDIETVLSTRDILRDSYRSTTNSAVLIGNPRFDFDLAAQKLEPLKMAAVSRIDLQANVVSSTRGGEAGACPNMPPGGVLCPLEGTEAEIAAIYQRLKQANWDVTPPYMAEHAQKQVVTDVRHPRLLHVATHGFFSPDQTDHANADMDAPSVAADPMLRSGLMFAGADRALKGEQDPAVDNGILTAYEAAGLDLENTELVVLSACDTGLGTVKSGEGVFGLRRALQEAGAQAELMSLWSVPDQETRELMTLFYDQWLSGKDKHVALHEAQVAMRKKTMARWDDEDRPFYWGAFVLVGP